MIQQSTQMETKRLFKPYIRKSGNQKGKMVGHYNLSINIDAYNKLMQVKSDLDMEHLTYGEFLLYLANFAKEHFGKGEELEAMKAEVAKATKKRDIKDIANYTEEEVRQALAESEMDEQGDDNESSDIP
jgi:hypothetical protein